MLLTLVVVGSTILALEKISYVEGIPQISKYGIQSRKEFANRLDYTGKLVDYS